MRQASGSDRPAKASDGRDARLKAALRANLARRKAQAKARAGDAGAANAGDTASQAGPANRQNRE